MKVHCRDVLNPECEWELIGDTPDDVVDHARRHALALHQHQLTADEERRIRERAQ